MITKFNTKLNFALLITVHLIQGSMWNNVCVKLFKERRQSDMRSTKQNSTTYGKAKCNFCFEFSEIHVTD